MPLCFEGFRIRILFWLLLINKWCGSGAETSVTRLIRTKRFIKYPYYDSSTQQYDLALIELAAPITLSMRVNPVCLPFMSRNWDLTGEIVTVLGQ